MNPSAAERILILDRDENAYAHFADCAETLKVTFHHCANGTRPDDLRGQRYLLAFAAFPNDAFFKNPALLSGTHRLVVMPSASLKRKAVDMVGTEVFGVLTKPFQPEEAAALIQRALEIHRFQRELNKFRNLEGLSEAMMDRLRLMAKKADPTRKGDMFEFVMKCIEKPLLEMVLEETGGNRLQAANVLGINRNTLRSKLVELGVNNRR